MVRSALPPDEVFERLSEEVDPERWLGAFWDFGAERDRDYVGRITPTSFSVRRRRRLFGPTVAANPRALGSLARLPDGGTLITAWFPRDVLARAMVLVVLVLTIPYVLNERDLGYKIIEAGLLVAIVLVAFSTGGMGKQHVRELLEIVAMRSQPWQPYGHRQQ